MIRYRGRQYVEAKYQAPIALTPDTIARLKASDWVTVYHGTRHPEDLIHGFDATISGHKIYPIDTPGLFVAPTLKDALEWGPYVFELAVAAKNLHGTYYNGKIGRQDPEWYDYAQPRYPESFRPELSDTLMNKVEPQALLVGTVGPNQILMIYERGDEHIIGSGRYTRKYTREEFIQEHRHSPVPSWFNPNSTRITPEDFFKAAAETLDMTVAKAVETFMSYAGDEDFLFYLLREGIGELGLSDKAARALVPRLNAYLESR